MSTNTIMTAPAYVTMYWDGGDYVWSPWSVWWNNSQANKKLLRASVPGRLLSSLRSGSSPAGSARQSQWPHRERVDAWNWDFGLLSTKVRIMRRGDPPLHQSNMYILKTSSQPVTYTSMMHSRVSIELSNTGCCRELRLQAWPHRSWWKCLVTETLKSSK